MKKNSVIKKNSLDEIKEYLNAFCHLESDPNVVLEEAYKEIADGDGKKKECLPNGTVFKALTLLEFNNGVLMSRAIPDQYVVFGIDLLRQFQKEYNCQTVSEKATAELAAINYIRTLEIQRKINNYLAQDSIAELGVKFLAIMSKELDRANRHYFMAIQTLKIMKQLPMQVNIKTNTAVVGQNQIVRTNGHG